MGKALTQSARPVSRDHIALAPATPSRLDVDFVLASLAGAIGEMEALFASIAKFAPEHSEIQRLATLGRRIAEIAKFDAEEAKDEIERGAHHG